MVDKTKEGWWLSADKTWSSADLLEAAEKIGWNFIPSWMSQEIEEREHASWEEDTKPEEKECQHSWGKIEEHTCGYDCTAIESRSPYLSQTCEKCGIARTVKGVCDHSWGKIEQYTSHIAVETDLTLTYQKCRRCGEIKEIDKTFW